MITYEQVNTSVMHIDIWGPITLPSSHEKFTFNLSFGGGYCVNVERRYVILDYALALLPTNNHLRHLGS